MAGERRKAHRTCGSWLQYSLHSSTSLEGKKQLFAVLEVNSIHALLNLDGRQTLSGRSYIHDLTDVAMSLASDVD